MLFLILLFSTTFTVSQAMQALDDGWVCIEHTEGSSLKPASTHSSNSIPGYEDGWKQTTAYHTTLPSGEMTATTSAGALKNSGTQSAQILSVEKSFDADLELINLQFGSDTSTEEKVPAINPHHEVQKLEDLSQLPPEGTEGERLYCFVFDHKLGVFKPVSSKDTTDLESLKFFSGESGRKRIWEYVRKIHTPEESFSANSSVYYAQ
jgi:hypothetical protein